jgi:hypothetical protein
MDRHVHHRRHMYWVGCPRLSNCSRAAPHGQRPKKWRNSASIANAVMPVTVKYFDSSALAKSKDLLLTKNCKRCGAPGEIRTPGLLLRRQPLYPAELRAHSDGTQIGYHFRLPTRSATCPLTANLSVGTPRAILRRKSHGVRKFTVFVFIACHFDDGLLLSSVCLSSIFAAH